MHEKVVDVLVGGLDVGLRCQTNQPIFENENSKWIHAKDKDV